MGSELQTVLVAAQTEDRSSHHRHMFHSSGRVGNASHHISHHDVCPLGLDSDKTAAPKLNYTVRTRRTRLFLFLGRFRHERFIPRQTRCTVDDDDEKRRGARTRRRIGQLYGTPLSFLTNSFKCLVNWRRTTVFHKRSLRKCVGKCIDDRFHCSVVVGVLLRRNS
jgi:hypothetical protein